MEYSCRDYRRGAVPECPPDELFDGCTSQACRRAPGVSLPGIPGATLGSAPGRLAPLPGVPSSAGPAGFRNQRYSETFHQGFEGHRGSAVQGGAFAASNAHLRHLRSGNQYSTSRAMGPLKRLNLLGGYSAK